MDTIKRDVYVLKDTLKIPIEITEETNAIKFEFCVRDYTIPADATAVVYSIGSGMTEPNKALADIDGNNIIIKPESGFFKVGNNTIQIRVISGQKRLISFTENVKCKNAINFADETEEQQQTLIEQILDAYGIVTGAIGEQDISGIGDGTLTGAVYAIVNEFMTEDEFNGMWNDIQKG